MDCRWKISLCLQMMLKDWLNVKPKCNIFVYFVILMVIFKMSNMKVPSGCKFHFSNKCWFLNIVTPQIVFIKKTHLICSPTSILQPRFGTFWAGGHSTMMICLGTLKVQKPRLQGQLRWGNFSYTAYIWSKLTLYKTFTVTMGLGNLGGHIPDNLSSQRFTIKFHGL